MSEEKLTIAPTLPLDWSAALESHFQSEGYQKLRTFLNSRFNDNITIFPEKNNIYRAFKEVSLKNVKVVILGQDPYHGVGQANGLAFGVPSDMPRPPSLKNVLTEVQTDTGLKLSKHQSSLQGWAAQGVLLLNSILTVEEGRPGSHADKGWEILTDFVIKTISDKKDHVIFMLWGRYAKDKAKLIDPYKHAILKAPHPSPLSANSGFFGCRHFTQANTWLGNWGKEKIDWSRIDFKKEENRKFTDLLGV